MLEHLPNKPVAMTNMIDLLAPGGRILFDVPSWYCPYGGHQQVLPTKLRFVPYFHLLPKNLYFNLLAGSTKERKGLYDDLVSTYYSRISYMQFRRLLKQFGLKTFVYDYWLINASYEIKFGLKERRFTIGKQLPLLAELLCSNIVALVGKDELSN